MIRALFPPAPKRAPKRRASQGVDGKIVAGKVLLVDDEDMVRSIARRMLERAGLSVIAAREGIQALEIFGLSPDSFLAVVLDLHMPKMDGRQAFEALRGVRADLPVLFTSGFAEADVAITSLCRPSL